LKGSHGASPPGSVIIAPTAPIVARRGVVIRTLDAVSADAAHGPHALAEAAVVAAQGAARAVVVAVLRAPRVVVGGLGVGGGGGEQGGGGDEAGLKGSSHGASPGVWLLQSSTHMIGFPSRSRGSTHPTHSIIPMTAADAPLLARTVIIRALHA